MRTGGLVLQVMVKTGMRIGTAAFALGLCLAGPQAAGVAAAEDDAGDVRAASAEAGSTPKTARPGRTDKAAPAARTRAAVSPRAAAVSASQQPRRAAITITAPQGQIPATTTEQAPDPVAVAVHPAAARVAAAPAPTAATTAVAVTGIAQILDGVGSWLSTLPDSPVTDVLEGALLLLRRNLFPESDIGAPSLGATAPSITVHNKSLQTIWVYNLTNTGDYAIPATPWSTSPTAPPDWVGPVSILAGSSAPVTLSVNNGPAGSPGNRIYIVEGTAGFTLPITPTSGVDPFYPPGFPADDSFLNYSFVEYNLYPATTGGGNWYTIDTSYIDEWSLPVQMTFTINGAAWTGAVDGKTYGFNDFDTVVSQLTAAGGPYSDLVSSGASPWDPQPPSTVARIIGPDKVWAQQFNEPASNINMNVTGWVPASYSDFVQYGSYLNANQQTVYPYAYNGTQLSGTSQTNFDFWRYNVTGPASTPYAIALRTAAIQDGFPADANGVYGFFTYPNDEAAGQFTNIPTAVSLDMYVWGSGDGDSGSVIPGGTWSYSSSVAPSGPCVRTPRPTLTGTAATDTFIMNYTFTNRTAPLVLATGADGDIVGIDAVALGARSTSVDVVDRACFLFSATQSQFVYETSTGTLYYDRNPFLPGYTGVLANLSQSSLDPANSIFVL